MAGSVGKSGSSGASSNRSSKTSSTRTTSKVGQTAATTKNSQKSGAAAANRPRDKTQLSKQNETATPGADAMVAGLAGSLGKPAPAASQSNLSKGVKGDEVKNLQKTMNEKFGANIDVDGDFGPKTQKAVRDFQTAQGLTPDGIAGPKTFEKLGTAQPGASKAETATNGKAPPRDGGKAVTKDEKAAPATAGVDGKPGKFQSPIPGAKITSNFGPRRAPKKGASKNHKGIDIKGTVGTPVGAAQGGVVARSGKMGKYGNIVEVKHPDGTSTRYAHLNGRDVKKGDKVKAGQELGQLGATGNVTGPHLHFEIRDKNGKALNPMDHIGR